MTKKGFEEIMRAAGAAAGKMRRPRKPSLSPTLITISLDPVELGALEVWIADQPSPKAQAPRKVRRLPVTIGDCFN